MKNTKKFLLSIAATAILFSCSDDDSAIEDSVSFEETANSTTSNAYILQEGKAPIEFDLELESTISNNLVEAEDQRASTRPFHTMRVEDDFELGNSVINVERRIRIRGNTSYNQNTNRRRGVARFSNIFTSPDLVERANFNTRTAAVWVSGDGRRGVYAGRITNVNQAVFEVEGVSEESPIQRGALYITYFRVSQQGKMFISNTQVVLPRGDFTDNEIVDEIFPGGQFAYGTTRSVTFPDGEVLTLPSLVADIEVGNRSRVNLRRRNRIN